MRLHNLFYLPSNGDLKNRVDVMALYKCKHPANMILLLQKLENQQAIYLPYHQ